MRWLPALLAALLYANPLAAATAADIARAIRENSFDRDECYRVRDLTLVKEDIRLYFTDGHLIFSKPVEGRPIAAVFTADVEGGDGEVILFPPDRGERAALSKYIHSPNLDEHFRSAVLIFTGDEYEQLRRQLPDNPANKKAPELAAILEPEWTPVLRNLGSSYQTRLTYELIGGPGHRGELFAAMISTIRLGNVDIVYDPDAADQIFAGQVVTRENRLYFDTWTSFVAKSARKSPPVPNENLAISDYRIEATIAPPPDLGFRAVTRVKVKPTVDGLKVATFDISPQMEISAVSVDGRPAEWLQRDALRLNLTRGGNGMFLVVPPEPLRAGREYEFEFRYAGSVVHAAGDRIFVVTGRAAWYPSHGFQFANFDLLFRVPRDLDLVAAGEVLENRVEGDQRIVRRRTTAPIRMAGFNLGDYEHARLDRGPYRIEVVANRALERGLQPAPQPIIPPALITGGRSRRPEGIADPMPTPIDPLERLHSLANEVAAALEFMAGKFGPPALPHLTVSPIPGAFGQGFPGLVYLSTYSYLKRLPGPLAKSETSELFFEDMLQAHETAHQWWGNRILAASYRDYWLMEALANYSALLYIEKTKGTRSVDLMLESYRTALLATNDEKQTVESAGPIVLGPRLESSIEPRAWRAITYGKGSWIMHMLRRRIGDERFLALLAEVARRYDHKPITTDEFRALAAAFLPPKSPDPKLEAFFDQWVYGTGIPALKLTHAVRGKAPNLRLIGTVEASEVDEDFSAMVPIEIQLARGRAITHWAVTGASFSIPVPAAPTRVALDPKRSVLRR